MTTEHKAVGVTTAERRGSDEVRHVQNVALADATAKAGVSPWTPSLFRVSACAHELRVRGADRV